MKLIFVSPTYGPIDPGVARTQRAAIIHASRNGHEWVGDCSPDRQPFAAARNNAVQGVLLGENMEDVSIMWVDSDIILPLDAITRLASYGKDFITGIYFQRGDTHWPLIAHYNEEIDSFNWIIRWPKNVVAPIDGCGFGCVLTSMKMLRDMEPPWFKYEKFSEDLSFCVKAKKAGYQLFVDTSVLCGHLADPVPIKFEDYVERHKKLWEESGCGQELVLASGPVSKAG
jgi:hypothetical protein